MASNNQEHSGTQPDDMKELLRAELKTWERAFEKANGHKPTPADVKANAEISMKYKLYHKFFRAAKPSKTENDRAKSEFVSTAQALKQVTPQKRRRDTDIITPTKSTQASDGVETVGPTPQLNGRMLGLFEGILDQTPLAKRMKSNWGEQLAAARKDSPNKFTPHRISLSRSCETESPLQETPTKSTSSARSRLTTPVTHQSSIANQHAFATPSFLRPTAQPVESPQSPSLPWGRMPRKIKGLSALISDFRANQQESVEKLDCEQWDDEDDLKIIQEHDSPGVAGRKPWVKKGAKRTKRRVIMRPVPQLEIPPSDDECAEPPSPSIRRGRPDPIIGASLQLTAGYEQNGPCPEDEEPSDLDDIEEITEPKQKLEATQSKEIKVSKQLERKAKGGYKIGKQVSGNFVSYKIRSKGQRGRGRGRFGRR